MKHIIPKIKNKILDLSPTAKSLCINSGVNNTSYFERLVENPFIFRHILPPPANVLDIGCWESLTSIQLAMLGYDVVGIDLQKYGYAHMNFKFILDDFNQHNFESKKFDIIINISAIEHFGLCCYKTFKEDKTADIKAMKKIKSLLNKKGQLLFTAPFGIHKEIKNFERIYDMSDINKLMIDFKIKTIKFYLLTNKKELKEVSQQIAEVIDHDDINHTYAVVCIDAELK